MQFECNLCHEPMPWEELNTHVCPRLKPQEEKMSATQAPVPTPLIRKFETGATRDTDQNKLDYEGFLSPLTLERYARYMHKHRVQADGTIRASDNWAKGMPRREYLKSMWRHFMDLVLIMRGYSDRATNPDLEDVLCACFFNIHGLLHEVLLGRRVGEDAATKIGGQ